MRVATLAPVLCTLLSAPAWARAHGDPYPGPHAWQAAVKPGARPPALAPTHPLPLPDITPGPDAIVYGYQAYWSNDLSTVPWDQLSHIAIFSAGVDSSGNLSNTSRWSIASDAVSMGAPYGVHVHLCVTDFAASSLGTLLSSATARSHLIDQLVQWVSDTGAQGVNIDFEGLPSSQRANMVTFVTDLDAAVDEVVLATPAVDWNDAWDYAALSQHADLFIMGYGYHWSGSSYAGPNDPLYGGSPWSSISLSATVQDYLDKGADPSRVILGLPLYGIRWTTHDNNVPTAATGTGTSVIWSTALSTAQTYGRNYDATSHTPWTYDGSGQTWYEDTDSLQERVAYALGQGLGGIGFWALHYDGGDPDLWDMIAQETTSDTDTGTSDTGTSDTGFGDTGDTGTPVVTDWVADAGNPFLAYVGDTVVLSAQGSTGPDPMSYQWTQVSGPPVTLSDPTAAEPQFKVRHPGEDVFELKVGDGAQWSAPARSYVVVLDPRVGRRYLTCGCETGPEGGLFAFPLLLLFLRVRRRRD